MLARTDLLEAADAELIALARDGESEAYGILYERHVAAAQRLANQLAAAPKLADDVVADAFGRMLEAVVRGGGPSVAVRLYILTAVRRVWHDRLRAGRSQLPADSATLADPDQLLVDPAFAGLETALIARAYQSLPERSRAVLWHTEIEHDAPAEVAPMLGLTRNGVVAQGRRAVDDLRQAYLQMHVALITQPGCRPVAERLAAFDRRNLSARDAALVSEHLARCEGCQIVHRELTDIIATVRGVVAPLVLGPAATAYLAGAGHRGPAMTGGPAGPAGLSEHDEVGADTRSVGSGSSLIPVTRPPGGNTAPLSAPESALLPGMGQMRRSPREQRRSLLRSPRPILRSQRIAVAAAVGVVLAIIAGTALAMTLTGNDNKPAGASQPPPAPSRHAAVTQPSLSPSPLPSPSAASPSPSSTAPPAANAAPPVQLTASLSISNHGASGHPAQVTFQVTNSGSTASGSLTAVIGVPTGASLLSDSSSGGSGWSCQATGGGAVCTHAALPAGQQAQGTLVITVSGSGACGQPVSVTITSGAATAAASQPIRC